jgi:hypothetical protein
VAKYKIKEGEALRNTENLRKELTLLSSVACGATCWPGIKVFALCAGYAHIIARLRSPLQDFCLRKEAMALSHAAVVKQK